MMIVAIATITATTLASTSVRLAGAGDHLSCVLYEPCYADAAPLDPRGVSGCDNQGFVAAMLCEDWSLFVGAR